LFIKLSLKNEKLFPLHMRDDYEYCDYKAQYKISADSEWFSAPFTEERIKMEEEIDEYCLDPSVFITFVKQMYGSINKKPGEPTHSILDVLAEIKGFNIYVWHFLEESQSTLGLLHFYLKTHDKKRETIHLLQNRGHFKKITIS